MIKKAIKDLTLGELSAVCKRRNAVCANSGSTCFGCPLHAACEHGPDLLDLDLEIEVPEEVGLIYRVELSLTSEKYVDENELRELLTAVLEKGLEDYPVKLAPESLIRVHSDGILNK